MSISQKKIKALDANFDKRIQDVLLDVEGSEFTPDKAKQRRDRANADDLAFCKIYYPHIFDAPFNPIHKEVATWEKGNYTLSGARLFGKSAFVYVGKVIKHIARGEGGMIGIGLAEGEMAEKRTASIARIIKHNQMLCYDYNIEFVQDQEGWYIIKSDGGQTTMVAYSVRKGLRALMDDDFKRFRLSVNDDLYARNTLTENYSEKVVEFITSEVWGQMEPDGLSITIGNSSTEIAPVKVIRENYTQRLGRHFSLAAMNPDETESNWPEKFSVEDLHDIRDSRGYDVWSGDFMDEPVEIGDLLDPQWIRFINVNLIQIVASITTIDPSHGTSPDACDKGIVTGGIDTDGVCHVTDIYLRKEPYGMVFDYLLQAMSVTPNHRVILFENDFAQWNFAEPYYKEWLLENKRPLPIVTFHSSQNKTEHRAADKESRMMNLVHPHQTGKIDYADSLQGSPDFENFKKKNYIRFGKHKNKKLDGLDALATFYIMIWQYKETGGFKPLKKRKWDAKKIKGWFR